MLPPVAAWPTIPVARIRAAARANASLDASFISKSFPNERHDGTIRPVTLEGKRKVNEHDLEPENAPCRRRGRRRPVDRGWRPSAIGGCTGETGACFRGRSPLAKAAAESLADRLHDLSLLGHAGQRLDDPSAEYGLRQFQCRRHHG